MHGVRQHLYAQRLPYDMCEADCRVSHIRPYLLSENLSAVAPEYGVLIHCEHRVERVHDHRIAYRLHIVAIYPDVRICEDLAVSRIGVVIVCDQPHRVAVCIQRVAVRIVHGYGFPCGVAASCVLVVIHIISRETAFVCSVVEDYVGESFAYSRLAVMIQGIRRNGLAVASLHCRAAEEFRLVSVAVIVSVFGDDDIVLHRYLRGSHDVCLRCLCVVVEGVSFSQRVAVLEFHVVVEHRLSFRRVVLSPV